MMSATSKVALVSPRFSASRRASSIAVGDSVQTHRRVPALGQGQGDGCFAASHVEDVAVELALLDQGGQFGLWDADAPWRPRTLAELGGFTAVGRFELEIQWLSHASRYINHPDICQWG